MHGIHGIDLAVLRHVLLRLQRGIYKIAPQFTAPRFRFEGLDHESMRRLACAFRQFGDAQFQFFGKFQGSGRGQGCGRRKTKRSR